MSRCLPHLAGCTDFQSTEAASEGHAEGGVLQWRGQICSGRKEAVYMKVDFTETLIRIMSINVRDRRALVSVNLSKYTASVECLSVKLPWHPDSHD